MNKLMTNMMLAHPIAYAIAVSTVTAINTVLLLHYLNL